MVPSSTSVLVALSLLLAGLAAPDGLGGTAGPPRPKPKEGNSVDGDREIELRIGGTGGVYFLVSPGELVVEVEKRDRNRRGRTTELRAILVGPDRRVLAEAAIPDDGRPRGSGVGPAQRVRLAAKVVRKGVYGLNVTVSNDRYGDDILWGVRANCPRYLVETARGHRDVRREEPIVLLNPARPGDVCFLPRQGAFAMELSGLPATVAVPSVYDSEGALIHALPVDKHGRAAHTFPPDVHRDAVPWRLHLPVQQAVVQIDGVTRWGRADRFVNLPYWTPNPASYFPFPLYRWLLTPYSRMVYAKPGSKGTVAFRVHNNAAREKTIELGIEFTDGEWPARLSAERIALKPKAAAEVTVAYTVPGEGEARSCHLRATPADDPDYTTYSTLTVRAGEAPATKPLDIPHVLKPYEHENERFGHLPDCPVDWEMYFGLENRPFVRTARGVSTWRDGQWHSADLKTAVTSRAPTLGSTFSSPGSSDTKIAFDRDNGVYLLGKAGSSGALLHSTDGGRTFAAYALGRRGGVDIEQFSGHNVPDGPPPVVRSTATSRDPKLRWRQISTLELFVPRKEKGRLIVGDPILLSKQSLGVGSHSGVPSAVVSRGDRVHVVWAEATDPSVKLPGVPTYVVTCDRQGRKLGEPVLVGYGAPPNDVHNRPCITMDSTGHLHVLTGTHGRPFHYARSLKPNDAHSGWTEAVPVGQGLGQTYIGMVCGPDDTLHAVFRLWIRDRKHFATGASFATLSYQRKTADGPWEAPRPLIVAPFSEYSIFYHRLTIDRRGRLFLSYDYWSTYWFYRTDHVGSRRTLMMSADGGQTWKLVQSSDLR